MRVEIPEPICKICGRLIEYGKAQLYSLGTCELMDLITDYFNEKIDKICSNNSPQKALASPTEDTLRRKETLK